MLLRRHGLLEATRTGALASATAPGYVEVLYCPGARRWWSRVLWWIRYRRASTRANPYPPEGWRGWEAIRRAVG